MDIILWIAMGGIAGWIASMIMGTNARQGLILDIMVGIIGAVAGGWLMSFFGQPAPSGFNIYSLLVAIGGAVALLFVVKLFRRA